jgi:uncharacterized protein YggE
VRLAVLLVAPLLVAPATAAADGTITALGSGQAKVQPANSHRNASIQRAVDSAYARAVPKAVADARKEAEQIAAASGLTLGAIQSVEETTDPYASYYPDVAPFGPGQYCGKIRRRVHVRDGAGRLHTVTRVRRRCIVPEAARATLAVTFEASPR